MPTLFCALTFMPPTLRTDKELARFMLLQTINTTTDNTLTLTENCLPQNSLAFSHTWWRHSHILWSCF